MGFFGTCALVIGNTVGAGIYFLPVSLAPFGALSIGGWLVTSLGAIILALMFAGLAKKYPMVGGPYVYVKEAFGDCVGFQMAWCYWTSAWISNAALSIAAVSYLSVFFPQLATNRFLAAIVGISLIWIATGINALGVRQTSKIQILLTILKLSPLIIIGIVGLFFMKEGNFEPLPQGQTHWLSSINSVALLTLYAFIGLESATIPAQHVRDPKKTIAKATIIGTLMVAILYIVITISVIGVMGAGTLLKSQAPIADVAMRIFGNTVAKLTALGAVISAFGCLLGWVLMQGQMPFAAAQDGLFPSLFKRLSNQGVPVLGMVISSLLITGLMCMNYVDSLAKQFTMMVSLSTFTMLVPYAGSALADLYLRIKENKAQRRISFFAIFLAVTSLVYTIWLIIGAGGESFVLGLLFVAFGFVVYFWAQNRKSLQASSVKLPKVGSDEG